MPENGSDQALQMATLLSANLHDTKNLMGQLMLRLDALSGDDPGVRDARFLCQQVNDRMVQLLLLFEVRDGELKPQYEAHNPEDFLLELRENARAWAGERLRIEMRDDAAPDYWYFDRTLLEMAMMNALHNAFRHARQEIILSAGMHDGMLQLSVSDDGAGYPQGILHSAGDERLPVSQDGTGLGLFFAGKIANAHNNRGVRGRLKLDNASSGGGAVFSILLP